MIKKVLSGILLSAASFSLFAQAEVESAEVEQVYREELEEQYNPNSINPIPKYEHHFKLRVWRTIDLSEKQNKGFFSNNGELSKLILDAVKSGELTDVYSHDSLTTKLGKDAFLGRLVMSQSATYIPWDPTSTFLTDDIVTHNGKNYRALVENTGKAPDSSPDEWGETQEGKAADFLPRDINIIRLVEDVIFDRRRSRLYYDMQAIQLIIPGLKVSTGVDIELGWFKYKDLEKIFRAHPQKAVWFNRQNTAQNKNFADAFLLRLFKGTIRKIENPDDATIFDTYSDNGRPRIEAVWATEWAEIMLMEKEHNLWEF
jgi:gliding motility associated protien GldN